MNNSSKLDFDNMSLEELNRLDAWMDKVAPASLRDADDLSVFDRSVQVGLKRNGTGNRVRTIDEDVKHQNKLNRKRYSAIDIKGHPCEVWHYDPIEGVISSKVMNYKWSDENKCWEKNVWDFHNTETSGLEPGMSLRKVEWCIDPHRSLYYITYHGKRLFAHRIAWQLYYGQEPHNLTFKDGNPTNLKLSNLVPVAGTKPKPYQATVRDKGKVVYLGRYETKEARDEAVNAFKALRSMGIV